MKTHTLGRFRILLLLSPSVLGLCLLAGADARATPATPKKSSVATRFKQAAESFFRADSAANRELVSRLRIEKFDAKERAFRSELRAIDAEGELRRLRARERKRAEFVTAVRLWNSATRTLGVAAPLRVDLAVVD